MKKILLIPLTLTLAFVLLITAGCFFGEEKEAVSITLSTDSIVFDEAENETVKVTVVGVKDKTVTWSVSWVDSSDEWTAGKSVSDYISVAKAEESENKIIISCLDDNGFSSKIQVLFSLKADSSVFKRCKLDFQQSVVSIHASFLRGGSALANSSENFYALNVSMGLLEPNYVYSLFPVLTNGTLLLGNFSSTGYFYFDEAFIDFLPEEMVEKLLSSYSLLGMVNFFEVINYLSGEPGYTGILPYLFEYGETDKTKPALSLHITAFCTPGQKLLYELTVGFSFIGPAE